MSISEHFRYRNDVFQSDIFFSNIGKTDDVECRISPTLRSMSMPTYAKISLLWAQWCRFYAPFKGDRDKTWLISWISLLLLLIHKNIIYFQISGKCNLFDTSNFEQTQECATYILNTKKSIYTCPELLPDSHVLNMDIEQKGKKVQF
jgi:hypothetical protein